MGPLSPPGEQGHLRQGLTIPWVWCRRECGRLPETRERVNQVQRGELVRGPPPGGGVTRSLA